MVVGSSDRKKTESKSNKLGLSLSVARVDKRMRNMRIPKQRVGSTASTYATAAIEVILKDVVQAANKIAVSQSSKQLLSRHLQVAVAQNDALNALLGNISVGTRETIPDPIDWILTTEQQKKRENKQKEAAQKKAAEAAGKSA
jgi:histone H2A